MRHSFLLLGACTLLLAGCKQENKDSGTPPPPPEQEQRDSTLWGRLGEDTGMSVLQLITDNGDTLDLYRTNPYSGEDGILTGDIRNYTDRFAMTVSEDGESMLTAVNVTQLQQQWKNEKGSIDIRDDGSIEAEDMTYIGWKLWNGHLLFSSEQQTEYGTSTRVDTMEILRLDDDTLVVLDHINQSHVFSKEQ